MYETESDISDIDQLDGNITNTSEISDLSCVPSPSNVQCKDNTKRDKISDALSLPTIATYNLRSLFPKVGNLTTDMLERKVDCGFLTEIWEQVDNKEHMNEIEKMLEISGLKYISSARPPNAKGVSYGGAAIVVNLERFSLEKINVNVPKNLEAVWACVETHP